MAGELILMLRDFFAPGDESMAETARPRLPALETLLATARGRTLARGWRAELAARFGGASLAGVTPAEAVAGAWLAPSPPSSPLARYWLPTPGQLFFAASSESPH